MKYYLVITPKSLTDVLKSESKRLMHEIYDKKVTDLYYRVETKQELDDPQRLYIKGDGRVIEAGVKPHISLIHNIELEDSSDFIEKVQKIVTSYKPITLAYDGVGNYDKNFTFFVKYKTNELLTRLRSELLILSKEYMSRDEHD